MTNGPAQKLAVLIDADNAQPSIIEGLLAEIAKYGTASVKEDLWGLDRPPLKELERSLASVFNPADTTISLYSREKCYRCRHDH